MRSSIPNPNDPSLAPTEILTPEQMADFRIRHWQRNSEVGQKEKELQDKAFGSHTTSKEMHSGSHTTFKDGGKAFGSHTTSKDGDPNALKDAFKGDPNALKAHASDRANNAGGSNAYDIANAPTIITAASSPMSGANTPQPQQDIANMATIIMSPQSAPTIDGGMSQPVSSSGISDIEEEESPMTKEHTEGTEAPSGEESGSTNHAESHPDPDQKQSQGQTQTDSPVVEENTSTAETPSTPREVKHVNGVTEEESTQDDNTFPVLIANTLVGERYEITQVIKDAKEEHVYEVVDHKGYLYCWNCGNKENTEGDEFCNDCGAELLNATYLMHEYPTSSAKNAETRVLQGAIVYTFVDHNHTYVIELPQALQSAFPNGVHLLVAGNSDAGLERRDSPNEDSTLVLLLERVHESISFPAGVFIVCDGMGGHDSGQEASRMATKIIAERIIHELLLPPLNTEKAEDPAKQQDEEHVLGLLQRAIEEANTTICQRNQREKTDMGCTLTGSMIVGEHAYIFNVGDSRTYILRDGKLYQLTNDHSLVGQLVAGGLIAPEDVYTHPQRSQIYRNIGDKLNVQIDVFKQQIHPGDILLKLFRWIVGNGSRSTNSRHSQCRPRPTSSLYTTDRNCQS